MKKLLLCLVMLFTMVFTLTSCEEPNYGGKTVKRGYLTVITSSDYAPYEFVDLTKKGQDKFVGSDMTMAKYIADQMGLKLKIKAMDFGVCVQGLDTGKGDIFIAGLTYKEDRASQALYTDAYHNNGDGDQILLMSKENAAKYTTIESMNTKECKIAVQAASVQAELVEKNMPNADIMTVQNLATAVDNLLNGTYTAVALASTPAQEFINKNATLAMSNFKFETDDSQDYLYMVVKKGNTELATAVNEIIAKIKEEGLYAGWLEDAKSLFNDLGENAGEIIPEK